MKKRMPALICAAAVALGGCGKPADKVPDPALSSPVIGDDREILIEKPGDVWEYDVEDDGSIELKRYTGSRENLKIPTEIDGKPVKYLGYGFNASDKVTTLEIPATIEEIRDQCMFGDRLETITVTEDNEKYYSKDGMLFYKTDDILFDKDELFICPRGKSGAVVVPEGTKAIGGYAFSGCEGITSVKLPESVERIEAGAFSGCTSLTSVNFPAAVTQIDGYTFDGCTSLETLDIPETVTDISQYPFNETPFQNRIAERDTFVVINGILVDATRAEGDIVIPDGVRKISHGAFTPKRGENTWLTGVSIPESVESVYGRAFEDCTALERVQLSSGLKKLGSSMFRNCKALKNIVIPDGVTDIGMYAFGGCENLESVTVPDSVTDTGYHSCFDDCEKVNVTYKGKTYTAENITDFYMAVINRETEE